MSLCCLRHWRRTRLAKNIIWYWPGTTSSVAEEEWWSRHEWSPGLPTLLTQIEYITEEASYYIIIFLKLLRSLVLGCLTTPLPGWRTLSQWDQGMLLISAGRSVYHDALMRKSGYLLCSQHNALIDLCTRTGEWASPVRDGTTSEHHPKWVPSSSLQRLLFLLRLLLLHLLLLQGWPCHDH